MRIQTNSIMPASPSQLKFFLKKYGLLLFSFITAVIFLGICSKSSPLFPTNDWVDVHCFLTMGKGLLNGMIPYVDLYEQKGPVLYFVYAVVALFSQRNMFGQFLLEITTFTLFLYYCGRIAQLFLGKSRFVYLILPVLSALIVTSHAFSHGGSVEQNCLFIFAYALYSVLLACHENRPLTFRESLTNGIYAGMLLWIKYTMLGFYIGLCLFVFIWYLIWVRNGKALLLTIGQFLLGISAVSLIVLAFFALVGGLDELFTCYFYNNIFLYPDETGMPLTQKIPLYLKSAMKYDRSVFHPVLVGAVWLLLRIVKSPRDLLAALLCFAGLAITTYMGMGYVYYALVLAVFTVFGLIGIARVLQATLIPRLFAKLIRNNIVVYVCLILLSFLPVMQMSYHNSNNTYMMDYTIEDMPSYQFAQIINQTDDPKILNVGFLDGGFYHAADVLPNCKFFCSFNIDAPGMTQTQHEYIQDGLVDYVIIRHPPDSYFERIFFGNRTPVLVKTATFPFEGYDFTYCLYRLDDEWRSQ